MSYIKHSSQRGMVSIMVTMLMMIVISLIVLGFAQVSRREQAQSLDRQLSAQAFFAAESGVNDARTVIKQKLAQSQTVPEKNTCPTTTTTANYSFNSVIDSAYDSSYTCLLVTTKLKDAAGTLAANDKSMVLPIETATGATIKSLRVKWSAAGAPAATNCTNAPGTYKSQAQWTCEYGVLRVDIVPTANLSRSAMDSTNNAGQKTMFLYPRNNGSPTPPIVPLGNGTSVAMGCGAIRGCAIDIDNLNGSKYALKLTALYIGGNFTVSALDAGGTSLELQNAQVQIDATGRARDVLRRIQVRLPLTAPSDVASDAMSSGSSICKHYQYAGGTFSIVQPKQNQDGNNPMCQQMTVVTPPPCVADQNDIIFSLDASSSMGDVDANSGGLSRLQVLRNYTNNFITKTVDGSGTGNHEGIVIWNDWPALGGTTQVVQSLTGNAGALHTAVDNYQLHDWTVFTAGLDYAYAAFYNIPYKFTARSGVPKIVIFITDGGITHDTQAAALASADRLKTSGVTIYTIGIGNSGSANGSLLSRIASDPTKYSDVTDSAGLQNILDAIASSLDCP